MYAIISDSGRQIKVEQGQELLVDYRDVPAGQTITFDRVMAVSDGSGDLKLGSPLVSGASVVAEVLGVERGELFSAGDQERAERRDEHQDHAGHDARPGERHDHRVERAPLRGAEIEAGLEIRAVEPLERGVERQHHERQVDIDDADNHGGVVLEQGQRVGTRAGGGGRPPARPAAAAP